jgi:phosphoadenosine phosphosulfate reductase
MVRELEPAVHVLFNNTFMEYPETYRFKKVISQEWALNLIETKPVKSFWWVVEHYGFPLFARKGHSDPSKNCCRYLKEYPVDRVLRRFQFDLYFTGLTRHESRLREFSARRYGAYFYSKRGRHWKCHPLQEWTEDDVWEYHAAFGLPHNELYDKPAPPGFDVRTACWCCTIPIKYGKLQFLRLNYPRLWALLLRRGLGQLLLDRKAAGEASRQKLEHLMVTRPCFFDKC